MPPLRVRAHGIATEQGTKAWVIVHAGRDVVLARFEMILAQPIKARVGLELAANEMPFHNLSIHHPGDGVRGNGTPFREVVWIGLADQGCSKEILSSEERRCGDEDRGRNSWDPLQ